MVEFSDHIGEQTPNHVRELENDFVHHQEGYLKARDQIRERLDRIEAVIDALKRTAETEHSLRAILFRWEIKAEKSTR